MTSELKLSKLVLLHGAETFLSEKNSFYVSIIVGLPPISMRSWLGI